MPKTGLSLGSSFEKLFHKALVRVFGCLCFPWLRPYFSHKLDPKSSPCVFLGYSLTHSVFLCFDHILKKKFQSRHVKFVENVFPFTSPPTSTTPVIDTDSALPTSSFTSGDYPAPSTSSPSSYVLYLALHSISSGEFTGILRNRSQSQGMRNAHYLHHVCRLHKATIYGLQQAPWA